MRSLVDHGVSLNGERRDHDTIVQADSGGPRTDRLDRLRLSDCSAPASVFAELACDTALKMGVDARALGVRALLHLPRVATSSGWVTRAQVARELFHSARQLLDDARAARKLIPVRKVALQELTFEPITAATAEAVLSSLHYLRSARPGSLNFALLDPVDQLPVSLCSVSPLEWRRVGSHIQAQFGIARERTWDVSRVYSCAAAPANAISFLLARVRSALRHCGDGVDLLITAVDPNLGFTGSSYRAANWQRWLTVQPRPYLYVERRYASPRQLRYQFGTSNLTDLQAMYPGRRFEQSRAQLLDSLIFCCRLNGETEVVPPQDQRRLHR